MSCSLHLLPLRKTDLFSSFHFCYITQSRALMIFIHKTETFLCYEGSLREVRASGLSLWSQRITSINFSVSLRMEASEISRKISSLNPLFNVWCPNYLCIQLMFWLAYYPYFEVASVFHQNRHGWDNCWWFPWVNMDCSMLFSKWVLQYGKGRWC